MSNYIFLTGSTGLLGEYLLRDLLADGHRVAVVVRRGRKSTAQERIETILQMWESQLERPLPRPIVFAGDVSQPNLGLDDEAGRWVRRNCETMIHNAAVLTFHTDQHNEPWRTNVEGTKNVLQFCEQHDIRKMHYVSTAYICGIRDDLVQEDEFDVGQQFRNDYERSKFQAESLVRQAPCIEKLTVYRPAIIVADSKTGYTATYHGLAMYLRLMSLMIWNLEPDENGIRHTPLHLPCTGDEPRNPVSVDWVAEVMRRLINNPAAHGGTYHITPDEPMTARQLIDYTGSYFNCKGVVYAAEQIGVNAFDALAHEHLNIYHDYLTTDPKFDNRNMRTFVSNLPCPRIDEEMIHRFLLYGEEDRWGKRRRPAPEAPIWVGGYLQYALSNPSDELATKESDRCVPTPRQIGLDVLGPGGGQWTLSIHDGVLLNCEPGLPFDDATVVRMTSEEFAAIIRHDPDAARQTLSQHFRVTDFAENDAEFPRSVVALLAESFSSGNDLASSMAEDAN